jgi:hypothetical protein
MNMFIQPLVLVAFLMIAVMDSGCSKDHRDIITPSTNCDYPPGNRLFKWRLDTVAWFPSTIAGVWAFSDTDAYILGTIIDGKPPYSNRIGRHWNGTVWENDIHGTWGFDNVTERWGDITIGPRNAVTGDSHFMVAVGLWGINNTTYAGIAEFDNTVKKWKSYQLQTAGELRSVWTDGKGYFIATGDNGMVYQKDSYTASWVYHKVPTDYNFTRIVGNSKNEQYAIAMKSFVTGEIYQQIWKFTYGTWIKLLDNQDSTGMPIQIPEAKNGISEIACFRCPTNDSLALYIVGRQSFKFSSIGNSLIFTKENLALEGLPNMDNAVGNINLFSPNDYWASGLRYQLYHWNGSNFLKMNPLPTLPYGQLWGQISRIERNQSGKTWMILEMESQVYSVVQAVP